jgi:protein-L-isoaspartate(D-aspartate) O-methyltransferase
MVAEPMTTDRSTALRQFYAHYVTTLARARVPALERAFGAVEREPFAGRGPWFVCVPGFGYIRTPDDDPAFLYQDTLIALDYTRGLNIGQPSAHALWLHALDVREGESVLQVGAGSGYYTAILAHLVGAGGRIYAYEIDRDLAARATDNLRALPQAEVRARSGVGADLPEVDAVYVCAGATQPSRAWLDALRPGGRLMFPLAAEGQLGGMLKITRPERGVGWPAAFVSGAAFVACNGLQDAKAGSRLTEAFAKGDSNSVRSFRTDLPIKELCWYAGDEWWLSTGEPR